MATVDTEQVTSSGLDPTQYVASAGGDKVTPGSIVRIVNGSAGAVTATMVTPQSVDVDLAVADRTLAVPAGEFRYMAATRVYRNPADGLVSLTWSATDPALVFEVIK